MRMSWYAFPIQLRPSPATEGLRNHVAPTGPMSILMLGTLLSPDSKLILLIAGPSSLGSSVRYSETMNTIAKAALIVVILLFVALLLWGLWLQ